MSPANFHLIYSREGIELVRPHISDTALHVVHQVELVPVLQLRVQQVLAELSIFDDSVASALLLSLLLDLSVGNVACGDDLFLGCLFGITQDFKGLGGGVTPDNFDFFFVF